MSIHIHCSVEEAAKPEIKDTLHKFLITYIIKRTILFIDMIYFDHLDEEPLNHVSYLKNLLNVFQFDKN